MRMFFLFLFFLPVVGAVAVSPLSLSYASPGSLGELLVVNDGVYEKEYLVEGVDPFSLAGGESRVVAVPYTEGGVWVNEVFGNGISNSVFVPTSLSSEKKEKQWPLSLLFPLLGVLILGSYGLLRRRATMFK